jgi:hypothetical protein
MRANAFLSRKSLKQLQEMNAGARFSIQIFFFVNFVLCFSQNLNADVCTPVTKSTKYILKENEKVSDILRQFKLEPIFGETGILERILKQNNVEDQDQIQPGTEISIPFSCEEEIDGWRIIDRGGDRLITLDRIDTKTLLIETDPNKKALDIIDGDIPKEQQIDLEKTGMGDEVSEALRYRMICEGEWTGTECITRYSTLYIIGGAWYNRYDGTDATTNASGVLLSKLNPEIGFGWNNYWTDNFRTSLGYSVTNKEIHPEVRERPIEQRKKVVNNVSLEAKLETGPYGLTAGIYQTEKLFYRFFQQNIALNDDGGVVVNAVPILVFRGALSYMFHQAGKYRFDGELGYSYLQGTKTSGYDVKPGLATDISVTTQHNRVKEYIFGTFKYEKSQQDTGILIQDAQEIGIKFGYAWKLKDW